MSEYLFTSESVSEGHPDKLADQISDAILDKALLVAGERAREVRCAIEILIKGDLLVIAGEHALPVLLNDLFDIAHEVVAEIGYGDPVLGFNLADCRKINAVTAQSTEIAAGVGTDVVNGAGDQGLMFGYACEETDVLMPLPITIAHCLMRRQAQMRKEQGAVWLRPDAKAQVTVRYRNALPCEVTDVVLSTQHGEQVDGKMFDLPATGLHDDLRSRINKGKATKLRAWVVQELVQPLLDTLGNNIDSSNCRFWINPSAGKFTIGGPVADAGLTGRKIIVDTYGGAAPHGGGAFSGKDPSKVDRSAAYAARFLAKNLVAAGRARRCLVQLSYAIGHAQPISVMVDTYGTGDNETLTRILSGQDQLDLSPAGIINEFNLLQPIYRQTAAYGHFGRADLVLPWEDTSRATKLFG